MPLRCKVFARLNNCTNCDEADVSFVQTQKNTKSLLSKRIQEFIFLSLLWAPAIYKISEQLSVSSKSACPCECIQQASLHKLHNLTRILWFMKEFQHHTCAFILDIYSTICNIFVCALLYICNSIKCTVSWDSKFHFSHTLKKKLITKSFPLAVT